MQQVSGSKFSKEKKWGEKQDKSVMLKCNLVYQGLPLVYQVYVLWSYLLIQATVSGIYKDIDIAIDTRYCSGPYMYLWY